MKVEMNFVADIRGMLADGLQRLGYTPRNPTGADYRDAHRAYMDFSNAMTRRIRATRRRVQLSRELVTREPSFSPPTRGALMNVAYDFIFGHDVTPRLSRGLKKRDGKDELLWDWGVHHMHLGEFVESDGFVQRTGDLLFVLVREHCCYFIDVRPHGTWADEDIVGIIHTNWPYEISSFRFALYRGNNLTPEERRTVRRHGLNAPIHTTDGTVYGMMGGGFTSSRESARGVIDGDQVLRQALHVENYLREHQGWLAELVSTNVGRLPDEISLKLIELDHDHADILVRSDAPDFGFRIPIAPAPKTSVTL